MEQILQNSKMLLKHLNITQELNLVFCLWSISYKEV